MQTAPSFHLSFVRTSLRSQAILGPGSALPLAILALAPCLFGCGSVVVETDGFTSGAGGGGGSTITHPPALCPAGPWGKGLSDPYKFEYGQSISVDGDCNAVVAGSFGGVMDLGGATITGVDEDVFVAKFDAAGQHLWSKSLGIEPFQGSATVATAPSGDVVLAGTFNGSIDFGTGAFNAPGQGIYLAQLDPNGKPRWAQAYTVASSAVANHVAVDAAGGIFFTGAFGGFLDLGNGPMGVAGEGSAFLSHVDAEGQPEWSLAFTGVGPVAASVAVGPAGDVLVAGHFQQELQVGPVLLAAGEASSAFVARLDASGNVLYARALPSSGSSTAASVAFDAQGDALVTGGFDGTLDLGQGPLTAQSAQDGFLVALDPAGETLWSEAIGGTAPLEITQIAAAPAGGAWLTGAFGGSLPLGASTLVSSGPTDGFFAFVDEGGVFTFAKQFGGDSGGADVGRSIAADPAGGAFVTGTFMGSTDLGSGPVQSAGGFDVFVAHVLK